MTIISEFKNYRETITELFDQLNVKELVKNEQQILIKPNAVDAKEFPITTHPESLKAIVEYLKQITSAKIIIAEGCGTPSLNTLQVFDKLGYTKALKDFDVEYVDLNEAELVKSEIPGLEIFPEYYLPKIAIESFIINVSVLKAHSLSTVTLSLKNMMGFAPPSKYQKGGYWRKSSFHNRMEESIIEINLHRSSDLILLDAVVGMADYHLGGAHCHPPINKMLAGTNPLEIDKSGARLLGFDWEDIPHIRDFQEYKNRFIR